MQRPAAVYRREQTKWTQCLHHVTAQGHINDMCCRFKLDEKLAPCPSTSQPLDICCSVKLNAMLAQRPCRRLPTRTFKLDAMFAHRPCRRVTDVNTQSGRNACTMSLHKAILTTFVVVSNWTRSLRRVPAQANLWTSAAASNRTQCLRNVLSPFTDANIQTERKACAASLPPLTDVNIQEGRHACTKTPHKPHFTTCAVVSNWTRCLRNVPPAVYRREHSTVFETNYRLKAVNPRLPAQGRETADTRS